MTLKSDATSGMAREAEWMPDVSADVQRALKPIAPPPAFRAHLREGLQMAAQYQREHKILSERRAHPAEISWVWVLGAVVVGTILGFVAMQLRARRTRRVSI